MNKKAVIAGGAVVFMLILLLSLTSDGVGVGIGGSRHCDAHVSATMDCATGGLRSFYLPVCKQSYSAPQLLPDFMAHQVEWSVFGKTAAFWSVLTGMPKDDDNVTAHMAAEFYNSGKIAIDDVKARVSKEISGWKLHGDVLDFGCGLGRLGIAWAQQPGVRTVACVEQSVHHVQKTLRFTKPLPRTAAFLPIVSGPDMLMALHQSPKVPKCYDFVNTLIVMQHMITPLQAVYLEQFCDVLRPGGVMHVHIPARTPMKVACTAADFAHYRDHGGMQMHWMPPESMRAILEPRGCDVRLQDLGQWGVATDGDTAYLSYMIIAQKRASFAPACGL